MNRSARELQVTIAAEGLSALFVLQPEESADYAITGTFTGTVDLEISSAPGSHFETAVAGAANTGNSGTLTNDAGEPRWYRFRSKSWTGGTALAEIWTSFGEGVQEIHGEDRIGIVRGAAVIFTAPAASLLLSAPRAGLDDGKELTIIDGSGYAHTVTTPANGINGAWNTITFGASIGDTVRLRARGGVWYATDLSDVDLSNV